MKPPDLFRLLSSARFERTVFVDVKAVATLGRLRFMLHDYAHGGAPEFYLNISELESEADLVGLHVGHPIKIDPDIVVQAEEQARREGLNESETQLLVISHVLSLDKIEEKLAQKRGGVPKEMAPFFRAKDALESRAIIGDAISDSASNVKASTRRL